MRIALAGAGAFGIKHLDALAVIDGVTVTSVISRRLEQAEEVAQKYGADHASTDLDDALAREDVDAVILCTPTQLHAQQAIAAREDVTFCSFGDMLRVPGSRGDLLQLKSRGSDVRVVYSPLDAVNYAAAHPERKVVFFAIGFETTAPANAMAAWLARRRSLTNFSLLVSQVLVPPAMMAIVEAPGNRVQAFLGPGHVCAVMGYREYESLCGRYRVPIVITGFEPLDILEGILMAVRQLEQEIVFVLKTGNRTP